MSHCEEEVASSGFHQLNITSKFLYPCLLLYIFNIFCVLYNSCTIMHKYLDTWCSPI